MSKKFIVRFTCLFIAFICMYIFSFTKNFAHEDKLHKNIEKKGNSPVKSNNDTLKSITLFPPDYLKAVKESLKNAHYFSKTNGIISLYTKSNTLLGYLANTKEICPDISGCRGHIEMLLIISSDLKIKTIKVLNKKEDSFQWGLVEKSRYLEKLKGMTHKKLKNLKLPSDIDGISGATVSSTAIKREILAVFSKLLKKTGKAKNSSNNKPQNKQKTDSSVKNTKPDYPRMMPLDKNYNQRKDYYENIIKSSQHSKHEGIYYSGKNK